jgi:hypothetical protein
MSGSSLDEALRAAAILLFVVALVIGGILLLWAI